MTILENEQSKEKPNYKSLMEELIYFCEQQGDEAPQYKKLINIRKNLEKKLYDKNKEYNKIHSLLIDANAKIKHLKYSNEDMKSMIKESL